MSEIIGPSQEEMGLTPEETEIEKRPTETAAPKKAESFADLVGEVHTVFGDDGVKAMNILHLRPDLAINEGMNIKYSVDELNKLINFIKGLGGAQNLDRLKWLRDGRENPNPWDGPGSASRFPG